MYSGWIIRRPYGPAKTSSTLPGVFEALCAEIVQACPELRQHSLQKAQEQLAFDVRGLGDCSQVMLMQGFPVERRGVDGVALPQGGGLRSSRQVKNLQGESAWNVLLGHWNRRHGYKERRTKLSVLPFDKHVLDGLDCNGLQP